ncbi:hypothetical protein GW17_00043318, partial [Ensete ventricosum]
IELQLKHVCATGVHGWSNVCETVLGVWLEDVAHSQAYESLSDGFGRTISALVGTPLKAFQHGAGTGSALATAVHAVPAAAIYPLSYSARAVYSILLGFRN